MLLESYGQCLEVVVDVSFSLLNDDIDSVLSVSEALNLNVSENECSSLSLDSLDCMGEYFRISSQIL